MHFFSAYLSSIGSRCGGAQMCLKLVLPMLGTSVPLPPITPRSKSSGHAIHFPRTRSASPLPLQLSLNTNSSRTVRLEHRRASAFAAWMRLMPNAAHGLPLPCRLARPLHQDLATQQHSPFPYSNFRSPTPQLGEGEVRKASLHLECLGRPGLKHSPLGQSTSNCINASVEESLGLSSAVLKAFSPLGFRFWGFDSLWLWHIGNWKLWR